MNNKKRDTGILQDFDRYRILFDRAPICIHEIDADGRLLSMNQAGLDLVGVDHEEQVLGRAYLDFVAPAERKRIGCLMDNAFKGDASEFEFPGAGAAPQKRYFSSCFIPCPGRDGEISRLIGISSDITARRETAAELLRLNHTYAMLSRCNSDLARSMDEEDLLNAFCSNLVEIGGYLFAWIGYSRLDGVMGMQMMAHAGGTDEDLSLIEGFWSSEDWRRSACWQAILTGQSVVRHDIGKEPGFIPGRMTALQSGARAMIALPLMAEGEAFGCFSLSSAEVSEFSDKEVQLLMELAEDLAFGIQTARDREARKQKVRRLRENVEQEERRRIAAILHDGVGQSVQSVNLGLKKLRANDHWELPRRNSLMNQMIDETGTLIVGLRDICQELRPLFLERLDLGDAISYHCSELNERSGLKIQVSAHQEPLRLDQRLKEQCFLGFREALHNALKHASAFRVDVTLEIPSPGSLVLRIEDDGTGFDMERVFSLPTGLGLSMIGERAESVGGHAEIYSKPGQGTAVTITVPIAANLMNDLTPVTSSKLNL